jgi:hypothetical protein
MISGILLIVIVALTPTIYKINKRLKLLEQRLDELDHKN